MNRIGFRRARDVCLAFSSLFSSKRKQRTTKRLTERERENVFICGFRRLLKHSASWLHLPEPRSRLFWTFFFFTTTKILLFVGADTASHHVAFRCFLPSFTEFFFHAFFFTFFGNDWISPRFHPVLPRFCQVLPSLTRFTEFYGK